MPEVGLEADEGPLLSAEFETGSEFEGQSGKPADEASLDQDSYEVTSDLFQAEPTGKPRPSGKGRGRLVALCSALSRTWFFKEFIMLLRLVLPLLFLNLFQQTPSFIALLFVGRFNTSRELTAVALGVAFFNVTGFSVLVGVATAADTLCPQSYGYKNYKRVGVIFQRGVLILSLACLPIAALWLNTESILLLLRQQPCVVRLTGTYLKFFVLALPGLVIFIMLQKYLQAQGLVWVFVVAGLLVNVVLVVCCGVFIVAADMGVIGAALSVSLSSSLAPIFLVLYIKWRKLHRQTWDGWSFKSLTEWWQFLRLGLPGFLMLAFEWWSFEISAIVVGTIDETELAINAVLIQYGTLLFMIPLSIGVAVNIRVGNELGAGNPVSARRVSYIGLGLAVVIGLLVSVGMLVFRREVARVFTNHQEVIDGTGDVILYGAIGIFFLDQLQGVISGILRATGRQAYAAVVNFISYYVVGLPLGITLALVVGLGTKGMWIGLTVADTIQTTTLSILLFTTNWKKQSEKAMSDAAIGEERKAEASDSLSTEEDSVSDGVHDSGIELKDIILGEEDKEGSLEGEDLLVSHKDTEKLVSKDRPSGGQTGTLNSNSSKCCKTKASIVVNKSVFLLVGVAVLLVGAVLAGTVRHHPMDDDQCSNTSLVYQSTAISDSPSPTRTNDEGSNTITPTRTSNEVAYPSPTRTSDEGSDATPHFRTGDFTPFWAHPPSAVSGGTVTQIMSPSPVL